jgi:hypothetical protein
MTASLSLNEFFQDLGQHSSASLSDICDCVQHHKICGLIVSLDQPDSFAGPELKFKRSMEFALIVRAKIEVTKTFQQPFFAVLSFLHFHSQLLPPMDGHRAIVDLVRDLRRKPEFLAAASVQQNRSSSSLRPRTAPLTLTRSARVRSSAAQSSNFSSSMSSLRFTSSPARP